MVWASVSGPSSSGSDAAEDLGTGAPVGRRAGGGGHGRGRAGSEGDHHLVGRRQRRVRRAAPRPAPAPSHRPARSARPARRAWPRRAHEEACGAEQRVATVVPTHLLGRPVGGLHVGAGVPAEPHGGAGGGTPAAARPGSSRPAEPSTATTRRDRCRRPARSGGGAMAVGRLDPPLRRADADADAVVLADQEQRQGQVLVGDAARRC